MDPGRITPPHSPDEGDLVQATRGLVLACVRRMKAPPGTKPSKPDDLTLITFGLDASPEEEGA